MHETESEGGRERENKKEERRETGDLLLFLQRDSTVKKEEKIFPLFFSHDFTFLKLSTPSFLPSHPSSLPPPPRDTAGEPEIDPPPARNALPGLRDHFRQRIDRASSCNPAAFLTMNSSSSSPLPVPEPASASGGASVVDASTAAAAARSSSAFGSSPGTSQHHYQHQQLTAPPPARGTGHRLWVHAPAIPENLLDEYFSGFGSVVDVYCPRDAQ